MPYEYEGYDDEAVMRLTEDDDFDYEGWPSMASGEQTRDHRGGRSPRPSQVYRPNRPAAPPPPRVRPPRPVGGVAGAHVRTPAGAAQLRFERPVATKESVDEVTKELKGEVAATAAAVRRLDSVLDKNTGVLDRKVTALEETVRRAQRAAQQQAQMSMLLPLLTSKTPIIEKMTFATAPTAGTEVAVTNATFRKDDNLGLIFMMMAMGGGMGGGDGEGGMNTMMLAMLAMGGGFGGGGSGGSTTTSAKR